MRLPPRIRIVSARQVIALTRYRRGQIRHQGNFLALLSKHLHLQSFHHLQRNQILLDRRLRYDLQVKLVLKGFSVRPHRLLYDSLNISACGTLVLCTIVKHREDLLRMRASPNVGHSALSDKQIDQNSIALGDIANPADVAHSHPAMDQ